MRRQGGRRGTVRERVVKIVRRAAVLVAVVAITLLAVRIWDAQRGPPLEPWHTFAPTELSAEELDEADWAAYLAAEQAAFDQVQAEVTAELDAAERVPINRYFEGSPVFPGNFAQDWNRSYVIGPDGPPVGAVVLLHGLTDAPYSQRHIAAAYARHGFVAIVPRLPAHGTVPAALTEVEWEDWMAATRLAVREARARVGADLPLHLVGFSNGGALATKYALDAIEDPALARPDRLVLISPMIGITAFARFAGFAGLPAVLPKFAKAAWLGQSHRITVCAPTNAASVGEARLRSGKASVSSGATAAISRTCCSARAENSAEDSAQSGETKMIPISTSALQPARALALDPGRARARKGRGPRSEAGRSSSASRHRTVRPPDHNRRSAHQASRRPPSLSRAPVHRGPLLLHLPEVGTHRPRAQVVRPKLRHQTANLAPRPSGPSRRGSGWVSKSFGGDGRRGID